MRKPIKYASIVLLAIVSAFVLFLLVSTLSDYRPEEVIPLETTGNPAGTMPADSTFTIMTWNLGYFGLGEQNDFFYDGGRMSRPDEDYYGICRNSLLEYLGKSPGPDFCFFQEVDLDSRRSYNDDQFAAISTILPGYQACFALNYKVLFVPMPVYDPHGKVSSGIATFSVLQSVDNSRYAFSTGFAWPVGLFMLDRCFMLTRIELPSGRDLVLINTHNEAFDNGSQRQQQLALLKMTMLEEFGKGNYVITGGDWNLNPLGYDPGSLATGDAARNILPAIEKDFLPEDWKWAFDPAVPTNRNVDRRYQKGTTPTTIIDFFVVSPNITGIETKTEDLGFEWSDHNPVRMKFRLP